MPIHNSDIANIFERIADLLEIDDANPFRIRAYRNAARVINGFGDNIEGMVKNGDDLTTLSGIGKDLAEKITEIVETGSSGRLEKLEKKVPPELSDLMNISGLGPKRVRTLYKDLNIKNREDLKKAAEGKKIQELDGFGEKTQQSIIEALYEADAAEKRYSIAYVEEIAEKLVEYLSQSKGVNQITIAGSYRRRKETVGDIDILITRKKDSDVMDRFGEYDDVAKVVSKGETRSTVILRSGIQVDLRSVPDESYGAALHYFTGSKAHNIAIRKLGGQKNVKINEYGVFKGDERIAGQAEKEVFDQIGLPYIEPELRENDGEIEAARKGALPDLVTWKDIKGDLHSHTKTTDGRHTLEEMAEAAQELGYEYLAISEHSQKVAVAGGLNAKRLAAHIEKIEKLNAKLNGITLLKAIEVDILEDGTLDLPDDILKELDFRVCSIHFNFNLSRKKQTERIIRAMDNPYFNILGHPTGRLINERKPYDVDMHRVLEEAKSRGCFMELNAHPDRLDINDRYCKTAKDIGVKIAISTDAHSTSGLQNMRFGIGQARRGWLEPIDVLNTRSLSALKNLLRR